MDKLLALLCCWAFCQCHLTTASGTARAASFERKQMHGGRKSKFTTLCSAEGLRKHALRISALPWVLEKFLSEAGRLWCLQRWSYVSFGLKQQGNKTKKQDSSRVAFASTISRRFSVTLACIMIQCNYIFDIWRARGMQFWPKFSIPLLCVTVLICSFVIPQLSKTFFLFPCSVFQKKADLRSVEQ